MPELNIHLFPDSETCNFIEKVNQSLILAGVDGVNFSRQNSPHLTLYLAEFRAGQSEIAIDVEEVSRTLTFPLACNLTGFSIRGKYVFLDLTSSAALSSFSEKVVLALQKYVNLDGIQEPPWLASSPENERIAKQAILRKYGSPNVMEGFTDPHFTVGVGVLNGDKLDTVNSILNSFWADFLGTNSRRQVQFGGIRVGEVGDFGSVLRPGTKVPDCRKR
jgi:hypothetical protein